MPNYFGLNRLPVNVAAGVTNQVLVAGVPGYFIQLDSGWATAGGTATTITFGTSTGDAAITPNIPCGVNSGILWPFAAQGWFQTLPGDDLIITTSAGSTVGLMLNYVLVPSP